MKTRSAGLIAHQALERTTLCWLWKVTRTDAQVFGFTNLDVDVTYDGVTYAAATGFTPTAIEGRSDLSVPNLDVQGMLDSAAITEADLLGGLWDEAVVQIMEINYNAISDGPMRLRTGVLGNVQAGRTAFTAELRGMAQRLQQPVGRTYTAACDATLGDARCSVNVAALQVSGSVTTATSQRQWTDTSMAQAADYFGAGKVTWLTGANAGLSMEVASFASGVFITYLPMPNTVAVGDTYNVVPGCRKRRVEDCATKFNNAINHRGFDLLPGNDAMLGNGGLES